MTTRRIMAISAGAILGLGSLTLASFTAQARPSPSVSGCPSSRTVGDADIVYLGQYGGAGPTMPYAIGNAGHSAKYTKVIGNPARPTFFVVSAYEPTVWDFSGINPSRIRGVHATGHYEQGVAGVRSSIPITLRHRAAGNADDPAALRDDCLDMQHKYEANAIQEIAGRINSHFGRMPSFALMTYQTQLYDLNFDSAKPTITIAATPPPIDSIRTERPVTSEGLQPAESGLMQLVASGHLMPVDAGMVRQWYAGGLLQPTGRMTGMMAQGGFSAPGTNAFVVLRSVDELPSGLFGAHQATFILAEGVTAPTDMETHSMFYRYSGPSVRWETFRSSPQGPFYQKAGRDPMLLRVSSSYGITRVDWDPSGPVRLSTSQPRQETDYAMNAPQYIPPVPRPRAIEPIPVQPFADREDDDGLPTWPLALFALGGAIFLQRRRIDDAWARYRSEHVPKVGPGAMADGSQPAIPGTSPADRVIALTSRMIDVSEDDATIAEMHRLRKDLVDAVSRDWDDDVANELEATVRHCSAAAAEYIALRAKASGGAATDMEASALESARTIRAKLRDLVAQQGRRDAGAVATHETFIRRRHGSGDLKKGDQA